MARVIGRLTKIGLGRETARGTAVAPLYWIPVLNMGFDDKIELKDNESGFGNLAAIQDSQVVGQWGEGDYEGKIFDKSVGLEMVLLFGGLPTSVQRTTTGVYDNSYSMVQSAQHISGTIALSEANYTGRFPLAMISSWSLEAETGDFVQRTVSLMSKSSASSADSATYTNDNEFIAKHIIVKTAAAGANDATIDAASALKVRSVSLEINKNADRLMVFGSNDPEDIINKQVEVSGEFELYYDDRTLHNLAKAGTHQALRLDIINSDKIIGTSGTHNPALRFTMREVVYEYPEKDFDNNDVNTISVSFKAMLNLTTGSQIECRVTNEVNGAVAY